MSSFIEKMKAQAQQKKQELDNRSESKYHELVANEWNHFVILPPWNDQGVFWKEVERHGFLVCPKKAGQRDCKMCKALKQKQLQNDTEFVDKNKLQSVAWVNAIRSEDLKHNDPSYAKILRVPNRLFPQLLDFIIDEETDITDPKAVIQIGIMKTQKGQNWKTIRYKDLKFSKKVLDLSHILTPDFLAEAVYNLDTLKDAQPATDKQFHKAIVGDAGGDDDDMFGGDDENSSFTEEVGEDDFDGSATLPTRNPQYTKPPVAKAYGKPTNPVSSSYDDDDDFTSDANEDIPSRRV